MDARSVFEARDEFHLLDVREPEEWRMGHVEGAIHVPLQELETSLDRLPRDKPLLCMCTVGVRSQYAATALAGAGFRTENLDGGLAAWQAHGFPLVNDEGGEADVWKPG